jgi:hypothetical protein
MAGLRDDECRLLPCPIEGSACGVRLMFKPRNATEGQLLHLGRGGLLHPSVATRLLMRQEGAQHDTSQVLWWELSMEAMGDACASASSSQLPFDWVAA